jgi:hypothetical protein
MTDRPDPGLPKAVQRVDDVLNEQIRWINFDTEQVEAIARAARADYPDVVRNAKAEALRDVATRWQFGGWVDVTLPRSSDDPIGLGAAQVVTDWLRAQEDRADD